ncbi:ACT domain-containing protein [Sebaldella sp. S0638]|uniref:ACT domain-containing protein n=1 Tax=Sebaldella sp. S0638 TaxID=2957809 RepID=UPI00209E427E|nr:ACT domain-containing protein [Sebaldella sp. S0638]MCP1225858.1 ACT domain-containing protein [Sebaldella sp. S0638]
MDGKVVVTVMGADKTGIVAGVSAKLNELDINIIDISQTIFENEIFAMIMLTEVKNNQRSIEDIQKEFKVIEENLKVKIFIQHEDIFKAMHRI